jgi:hypothetical protein
MALQTYYTTAQAAKIMGVKPRTLEVQRRRGTGCPYRKVGARMVRYAEEDIAAYMGNVRTSTTEG